jgi:hypothetical protein
MEERNSTGVGGGAGAALAMGCPLVRLREVARELEHSRTPAALCRNLAGGMARQTGLPDVVVYLREGRERCYRQTGAAGPKGMAGGSVDAPLSVVPGQGVVGSAVALGEAVRVADTRLDDRYLLDDAQRLSELSVPVRFDGEVLAVIDAEHPRADFFGESHAEWVGVLAEVVAPRLAVMLARERLRRTVGVLQRECGLDEPLPALAPRRRMSAAQPLDRAGFCRALEDALRSFHRADALLASPLLGSVLVRSQPGDPIQALRAVIRDGVEQLAAAPATLPLARLVEAAYLHGDVPRGLLSDRFHIGQSTLRRRLAQARGQIAAALWSREQAAERRLAATMDGEPVV